MSKAELCATNGRPAPKARISGRRSAKRGWSQQIVRGDAGEEHQGRSRRTSRPPPVAASANAGRRPRVRPRCEPAPLHKDCHARRWLSRSRWRRSRGPCVPLSLSAAHRSSRMPGMNTAGTGPDEAASTSRWCECEDSPVVARGPLTMLDHDDKCGFPEAMRERTSSHDCSRCVRQAGSDALLRLWSLRLYAGPITATGGSTMSAVGRRGPGTRVRASQPRIGWWVSSR